MNTNNRTLDQISALVDNELTEEHLETVFTALREPGGRATWDVYHQIGDVLRSDEMARGFSPDFAGRMRARLDAEPTVIAPQASVNAGSAVDEAIGQRSANGAFKRYAMPVAVAAGIAVALISGSQLRESIKGGESRESISNVATVKGDIPSLALQSNASPAQNYTTVASAQNGVILRDPRIDQYLQAHQRFSPSLYSTAQYARSATFASDSDK